MIAKEKEYGETWTGFEIVPLEIEQTKLNMAQSKTQLRMGVSVVHVEAVTEMMPIAALWSPEEEEEDEEGGLAEDEEKEDGLVEDEEKEDEAEEEEAEEDEETVDEDGFADDEEEEDEVEEATEEEAEEDD